MRGDRDSRESEPGDVTKWPNTGLSQQVASEQEHGLPAGEPPRANTGSSGTFVVQVLQEDEAGAWPPNGLQSPVMSGDTAPTGQERNRPQALVSMSLGAGREARCA